MKIKNLKSIALVLLCTMLNINYAWGVTFDFTTIPDGWPNSSSSAADGSTEYTYTVSATSYSFLLGSGTYVTAAAKCFMPSGTSMGLPALSGYKLTKVVGTLNSEGSPSTKSEVSITTDGSTLVTGGGSQTWNTKGGSFTYNLTGTAANTRYYLTVATKNCQMESLELTYTATGGASHTVTFEAGDGISAEASLSGSSVTLPAATPDEDCAAEGWSFYGWSTSTVSLTSSAPSIVGTTGASYAPPSDITLYAVYKKGNDKYVKITSTGDLTSGDTYIIAAEYSSKNYVMTNSYSKSGDYGRFAGSQIDETAANEYDADAISDNYRLTITGSTNLWFIKNIADNKYVDAAYKSLYETNKDNDDPYSLTVSAGLWNFKNLYDAEDGTWRYLVYTGSSNIFEREVDGTSSLKLYKLTASSEYASEPACASCDKLITVTAGTPTNGTFTLNRSGSDLKTCHGLSVIVTPTPNSGYQVATVTATTPTTGGAPTVTNNGNGTWTVTYGENSTGSSEINVTFEVLVVTINFASHAGYTEQGGATVRYNADELLTYAETVNDDYSLQGYWTTAQEGGTKVLNTDGSFAAANVTDYITSSHWSSMTTPITLYARWTCEHSVAITGVASGSGTVGLSRASIETCKSTAASRQVTITATPNDGYEASSISYSGDGTATKISGPTTSAGVTTWVYELAQRDEGSGTFTVTFSLIPTYTVTWNAAGSTSTTNVVSGEKPAAFPSDPTSCDLTNAPNFYGWATEPWDGHVDALTGKTVYTAVGDLPAVTADITYYAVWNAGGGSWEAVTSLSAGDKVVFAYESGSTRKEMTGVAGNLGTATDYTTSMEPAGTYLLTVEAGTETNSFAFKTSGNKYIAHNADKKIEEKATKDAYGSWTISDINEDNLKLTNCSATSYKLQYNTTYPRWTSYSSSQSRFMILKQGGGGHYITTCCTEVSRPVVSLELHATYVTLTWPAQAEAESYAVTCPGGTVGSITGTSTKSCTITGLTANSNYTYTVTANGPTCSQAASASFKTADCDDVPNVTSAVATSSYVTFNWTNSSNNTTIYIYSDEACSSVVRTKATTFTTPDKIDTVAGLESQMTYYYILKSDGTCASLSGSFTTLESRIVIAEWDTCAVYLDLGDASGATAIIANQNTQAEVKRNYADSLFFSKYFEADGENKMLAIYNGTKDTIDLSNYRLERSQKGSSTRVDIYKIELSYYGRIKPGFICPEEEIILARYSSGSASAENCLEAGDGHENWYNETDQSAHTYGDTDPSTFLQFSGPMSIGLWSKTANKYIDVIGATTKADGTGGLVQILSSNSDVCSYARYSNALNDKPGGFYQLDGDNYLTEEVESDYFLSTNRCLLIRDNRVKSGLNSVSKNVYTTSQMDCTEEIVKAFTTLSASEKEWRGFQIGSGASGSDATHSLTCEGMAELGKFNYNEYYAKYDTIKEDVNLNDKRQPDGTYRIDISQLDTMSCTNLRIIVTTTEGEKLTGTWKIPIFVTNDGGTGSNGDVKTDDAVFVEEGEDCATCDVVVMRGATLEVVKEGYNEVRNIEVYQNGKLYVPASRTYAINRLIMRSKEDTVPRADIRGAIEQTEETFVLDKRIKAGRWYKIALPYRCKISDVTFRSGEKAILNTHWYLQTYDGDNRANGIQTGNWHLYSGEYMEPGVGYNLAIDADILDKDNLYAELRFPMTPNANFNENASVNVPVKAYGANNSRTKGGEPVTPNHLGWNLIGNPYMMDYTTGSVATPLKVGQLYLEDNIWKLTGSLRYVVALKSTRDSYEQIPIGATGKEIEPFMAYFVQIDGESDNQALNVTFSKDYLKGRAPRRQVNQAYEEEDNTPVWCAVNITNPLNEKDETTLLISDDFTEDYDMMNDFAKMRGDKYKEYSKPVLASRNTTGDMAFNAVPDSTAAKGVPLTFYTNQAGQFTFRMDFTYGLDKIQRVEIYDDNDKQWHSLMNGDEYSFYSDHLGDNTDRFRMRVVVDRKAPQITTDLEPTESENSAPSKLLINGHVYIFRGGRIYDITGKQLR